MSTRPTTNTSMSIMSPTEDRSVAKKAAHNAVMSDQKKNSTITVGSATSRSSRENGVYSTPSPLSKPSPSEPRLVDNTKGRGEPPARSKRPISPVSYEFPKTKAGTFCKLHFVNNLEKKYQCPICRDVLRYPVQFEECGHRVCSSCLLDIVRVSKKCPIDQKPICKEHTFPDSGISREIGGLKVKCMNFPAGCLWMKELRNVCAHQEGECRFVNIECPNECGADFERRFLDQHIASDCPKRNIVCKHCEDVIHAGEIKHHEAYCEEALVVCPNGCGEQLLRKDMETHVNEDCGNNAVHCTFYEAGCLHMCPRNELQRHLRSDALKHLDLMCVLLQETRKIAMNLDGVFAGSKDFVKNLGTKALNIEKTTGSQLLWRLDNVSEKLAQAKRGEKVTQYSKQFFSGPHGYKLMAATCLNGTGAGQGQYLPIYLFICKGEWDNLLPWPFKANVTITMLDQLPDIDDRTDITYTIETDPDDSTMKEALVKPTKDKNPYFGVNRFGPLSIIDPSKKSYVRDDSLFIQIVISQDNIPAL